MRNSFFKRSVAILLAAVLAVPGNITALADTADAVTSVQGERLAESYEGETARVYFGTSSYGVSEEERTYEFTVFREGDLSAADTITVHSLDVSAVYGKDYVIKGVKADSSDDRTLLELAYESSKETPDVHQGTLDTDTGEVEIIASPSVYVKPEEMEDEALSKGLEEMILSAEEAEEAMTEEQGEIFVQVEEIVPQEAEEGDAAPETGAQEHAKEQAQINAGEDYLPALEKEASAEQVEAALTASGGRLPLSELKHLKTGEEVRVTESSDAALLGSVIADALLPEYLKEIRHSSEMKLSFAPGESEKTVSVKILDDAEAEGTEMFSLVITEATVSEIVAPSGLSVTITDDEEYVPSVISFTEETYDCIGGTASVTLRREGLEGSLASVMIAQTDPETGEASVVGEAVFTPYETEKTVALEVDGDASLFLTDFDAASAGEITEVSLLGETDDDFHISFNGKQYLVSHSKSDKLTSTIWDESYDPILEVGTYILPVDTGRGGMFAYYYTGKYSHEAWYDENNQRGYTYWYDWRTTKKGCAGCENSAGSTVDAIYYQYVMPDWEQTRTAYGGQKSFFYAGKGFPVSKSHGGQFGRTADYDRAISIMNDTGKVVVKAEAVDNEKNKTPRLETLIYGFPAMYKMYNVSLGTPDEKKYISGYEKGQYLYTSRMPATVELKCGAQVLGDTGSMNIYANPDPNKSNLLINVADIDLYSVSGGSGIFGNVTGAKIVVRDGSANDRVTVNYPEDFKAFLSGHDKGSEGYSPEALKSEFKKIDNNYACIPYDRYFIEWIESVQKSVIKDGQKAGYYQTLKITPIFAYNDVSVTVAEPAEGTAAGRFADDHLTAGKKITGVYHAGDMLDLSMLPAYGYRTDGYEVSTDGGITFNTVRDTKYLVLQPNTDYVIRPGVIPDLFYIEIETDPGDDQIYIPGLIEDWRLTGTPLEGKKILCINRTGKTLKDMITPKPGEVYAIQAFVQETFDAGGKAVRGSTVERTVFTDKMTGKSYQGGIFYFTARQMLKDNKIKVSHKTVKTALLKERTISGSAVMEAAPIRNDAMGKRATALTGYQVETGSKIVPDSMNRQFYGTSVSSLDENGMFTLNGVEAADGEVITILVGNGLNDKQVFTYKVGSENRVSAGNLALSYPFSAPKYVSLLYGYMKKSSEGKTDLTDNTVRIFANENLTLTVNLDLNGHEIEKLVFTVFHSDGKLSKTYEAFPTKKGGNQYQCVIENMIENVFNGDYMTVYAVDKTQIAGTGVVYPALRTGLTFYTENELVKPKNFDISMADGNMWGDTKEPTVDVPLFGPVNEGAQSGTLNFTRTNWPDGNGYSLLVNFDALMKNDIYQRDADYKRQAYAKYSKTVKKGLKEKEEKYKDEVAYTDSMKAEYVNNNIGNQDSEEEQMRRAGEIQDAINESRDTQKKLKSEAKDEAQKLNADARFNFDIIFCLNFEFLKVPDTGEYVLAECTATIGGSFAVSKTWYTAVSFVPVFLNLTFNAQTSVMVGGACPEGINAVSGGDFDNYGGNVPDLINEDHKFVSEFDVRLSGKITVGAGLNGVLSARGFASVGFMLLLVTPNMYPTGERWGTVMNASGGIGFDILICSINISIANMAFGDGLLKKQTSVSFFNGTVPVATGGLLGSSGESAELLGEGAELLGEGSPITETVEAKEYDAGGSVAEGFITNRKADETPLLGAQLELVKKTTLLTNGAERMRPEIAELSGNRKFMTFIGKRPGEGDTLCLFYTIQSAGGNWTEPAPVADDGTFDAQSDVIVTGSGDSEKVTVVWIDADKEIDGLESFKDKLNSLSVSAAAYDVKTGTMSEEIQVSGRGITVGGQKLSDYYLDCNPHLSTDGQKVLCTFLTRDIDKAVTEEEVTDITGLYSTVRRSTIDPAGAKPEATEPEFITVKYHGLESDPMTLDYCTEVYHDETYNSDYVISAWSVDMDGSYKTEKDRQVYIMLTDRTSGKTLFPAKVSTDQDSVTSVQLNKFGGEVYVSWISGGDTMNVAPLSGLIRAVFHSEELGGADPEKRELYGQITKLLMEHPDDPQWVAQSILANVFKEHQGDVDYLQFEESLYAKLKAGIIPKLSGKMKEGEGVSGSIDDYRLAYDGKHVYVFYTDYTMDLTNNGKELYAICCYEDDNDGDEDVSVSRHRLSKPVRITRYGALMDEFDIFMNDESKVTMVTDYMTQTIDKENGGMIYSDMNLVQLDFEPVGSVVPVKGSVSVLGDLVPGETVTLKATIENNGILDARGADVEFYVEGTGGKTKIAAVSYDQVIESSETADVYCSWTVPENVSGMNFVVKSMEKGVETLTASNTITEPVPYHESIRLENTSIVLEDGKAVVSGTVRNAGNAPAEAFPLRLSVVKGYGEDDALKASVTEEGLAPGQSRSFRLEFTPQAADFNAFGQIKTDLSAERYGLELSSAAPVYYSDRPVIAEINEGAAALAVAAGGSQKLAVTAAPWSRIAGSAVYVSKDPLIASVSEDGTVKGISNGTTEVTVYYPLTGVQDCITVRVGGSSDDSGSHGEQAPMGPSSAVLMNGSWKQNTDGGWSFVKTGGGLFKGWGYISDGSSRDYYHIAENGIMDHGWYYDPKERNWYYLNEKHDGRFGAMMRGWIKDSQDGKWYYLDPWNGAMRTGWIKDRDGKWYYLSPGNETPAWVQDASGKWIYTGKGRPAGSMYAAEKTPDGYTVGADGAWTGK